MARLELTSLSSLALEESSDSFDLVFDVSSKSLPAFSAIDCWRGRCISPLRDRVMVEWLCSHYEAEILLESMISEINETIKKWSATVTDSSASPSSEYQTLAPPSTRLLVTVACQTGAQHSVCFVEKLYEKYSFESPLELQGDVRVEVKRQHCEATKGEWLNTTDAIWQHSRFPVRHLLNHRDLVMNRAWSNFPLESTRLVEAGFHQDPFGKNLDIGKHIINFERGVLLNKKSQEEFRIRSTIPRLEGRVQSSWFEDDEYKLFHKSYSSAGILFYSVHPQTGEAAFLLGHMTYSTMSWCDFGGIRNFGEKARYTAARECYEETLGILGKTKHLASMLENYEENNVFKIVNKDTRYVGHFLRIPYKDYPTVFEAALLTATDIVEVDEMRWFSLSCLRHVIHKALLDQYDLKVEPLNVDGSVDFSRDPLPLRLELVHSLCIAEQLGVLESIKHIAKEVHEKDQPPPPPYVSYPRPSVKTSHYTESTSQETVCSRNLCALWDGKERLDPEAKLIVRDDTFIHCEASKEDSLKDSTSTAAKAKHCSDNAKEESLETKLSPAVNESSISTSLYVEAIDVAVSSSSLGREGLRRRRKEKTNESSLRKAKDTRFIKKAVSRTETVANNNRSRKFMYYGIGAGTFLY